MGLVPASDVPPISIIRNAERVGETADRVIIKGDLVTVTIDDIIAKHGPRIPDVTQAPKHFTAACVVFSERPLTAAEMAWFESLAASFAAKTVEGDMSFAESTGQRATLETTLPSLTVQ